jgi:hypothetical protein
MLLWKFATILLVVLFATLPHGSIANNGQLSKQDGDRLQSKIDEIAKNGAADPVAPKKTRVTENELNSYLNFNLREKMPKGLANPHVSIVGDGRLAGRVSVDFDEFNRQRTPRGFMDPLSYLSGKVPVSARGFFRSNQGKGQFQLESADVQGVPLPKPLLQELVRFFSRSDANPKGIDIDAPFEFPAKIREIAINKGEAVVIQ